MSNDLWITVSRYDSETNSYINENIPVDDIVDKSFQSTYAYMSHYVDNTITSSMAQMSERMSYLISYSNRYNKIINSSIIRNNSKKISELKHRDTITKYQGNSWIPIAQYDHRINTYHNIAMNVDVITSYSINEINKDYEPIHKMKPLSYDLNESYLSYAINDSKIAQNIVCYSISYTKNYLDWQFL